MRTKELHFLVVVAIIFLISFQANANVVKTIGKTSADFTSLFEAIRAINNNTGGLYVGSIELQIIDDVESNTPALHFNNDKGVGSVQLINGGTGYTSAPTVTFSGGGGSGATAEAVVTDGVVAEITITAKGKDYSSAPTVTIEGGGGSGATGTVHLQAWTTVKIYPTATNKTISYAPTEGTLYYPFEFRGGDNLTIDGRLHNSNGTVIGNSPDLTIASVRKIIVFTNAAQNNTVTYCNLKGSAPDQFIALNSSTGENSNNVISYNNITSLNTVRPNTVFALAGVNVNISIINNNIYNCVKKSGIYFGQNNTNCIISGNSFYETEPTTQMDNVVAIHIFDGTNINLQITNNFIGGNAPKCEGTWVTNNAATEYGFTGIYLRGNADAAKKSIVRGNTIKSFDWSTIGTAKIWVGIDCSVNDGVVDVLNNSIGKIVKKSLSNGLGINLKSGSAGSLITGNFIYDITSTRNCGIYGININSGVNVVANNVISLGGNASPGTIYAVNEAGTGGNLKFYFNTVCVSGSTPESDASFSMALRNGAAISMRDFRNNILVNTRVNGSGATGKHFAINLNVDDNTNLICNNNDLFVNGDGTAVGNRKTGGEAATLAIWQAITNLDDQSFSLDPLFLNTTGTSAYDYKVNSTIDMKGSMEEITAVTKDFDNVTRDANMPRIGAFETRYVTGLSTTKTASFNILRNGNNILIPLEGENTVELYAMNGQLIEKTRLTGSYSRTLNNGLYVVRVNGISGKIVL
jgi:hypothetical protein